MTTKQPRTAKPALHPFEARREDMRNARKALVLQGGGALGAYQAGVYEALIESDSKLDWVAGVSIGAINAALIAGNAPEHRVSIACGNSGASCRQGPRRTCPRMGRAVPA
jgi:NTE family protein